MRFRSPLLSQSRFLSFPPGTEMVHFPGFARARLWIHRAVWRVYLHGFPHSEIPGSKPVCGSPRLIAAYHVLHRLLLPRHPPCALSSLTIKFARHIPETNPGRAAQILCRQSRSSHDCSSSFKFRVSSARRRSPRVIRNWKLETETGYVHQRDIGTHKNLHFAL
jgi:hypothetical protein